MTRGPINHQTEVNSARCVGYVRVSKEEQHLSPIAQRQAIQEWAAFHGMPLLGVCEDIGVRSSVSPHDREGMSEALTLIREKRADFLVVTARDRLARDVAYAVLLEAELRSLKPPCRVVVVSGGAAELEPETPERRVMTQIVDVFAEYERAKIRQRTKAGVAIARAEGRLPGPKKWETLERGQATIQLVKYCKNRLEWSNIRIAKYCAANDLFSPHKGTLTLAHVRKCLASEWPEAVLDMDHHELCLRAKGLPYFETKFARRNKELRAGDALV